MPEDPACALLVFDLADELAALPLENVERIAPMVELAHPPSLPPTLEGVLNLAGERVPVLHLNRLLELSESPPDLYSMLIVLRGVGEDRIAIRVSRVHEVLSILISACLPLGEADSFNACSASAFPLRGRMVHVLSPARILLQKERHTLSAFLAMEQRRLLDWEVRAE